MTDNFLSFIFLQGKNNPKIELPQSLPPIHHFYPRNGKHCPRDSKYGSIFVRIIPSSKNSGLALRERHKSFWSKFLSAAVFSLTSPLITCHSGMLGGLKGLVLHGDFFL